MVAKQKCKPIAVEIIFDNDRAGIVGAVILIEGVVVAVNVSIAPAVPVVLVGESIEEVFYKKAFVSSTISYCFVQRAILRYLSP